MAIVKMKKLKMVAMQSEKDELLHELQLLGCLEISRRVPDEKGTTELQKKEDTELPVYKSLFTRLSNAIKLLDKYAYVKTALFTSRKLVEITEIYSEALAERAMGYVEKLEAAETKLLRLYADESRQEAARLALELWRDIEIPLDTRDTQNVILAFGVIPPNRSSAEMKEELSAAAEASEIILAGADREQQGLLVLYHKSEAEEAAAVLRKYGFNRTYFKDYEGTARANIRAIEDRLDGIRNEIEITLSEMEKLGEGRDDIKLYYDRVSQEISACEAKELLMTTESAYALEGWIAATECERFERAVSKYCCAYELTEPEEGDTVPVALRSNSLTRPLNMVTEMYSLPAYHGIDPNPLIMPFFTIFFGIMYNDMGYGLVLLLVSILVRVKMPRLRGMVKYMFELMTLCGITSIIVGALTGSFFGDVIPTLGKILNTEISMYTPLFNPLEDPMLVLIGALAVGAVHVVTGMAVKAYMLIRDGHVMDAVYDVGSWWLLFAGIAVLALGGTSLVALAGIAALVLTQGRKKPTIAGKIIGGIASLYDITAYFGDILSYSRLMALMLAGGVVATVVNMLGSLPGNIFVFIIIFLVGHVFNMGINIIGTYVHAARLQYLEYFGKFYEEGGKAFRPLAIRTKYVDVIKEEI